METHTHLNNQLFRIVYATEKTQETQYFFLILGVSNHFAFSQNKTALLQLLTHRAPAPVEWPKYDAPFKSSNTSLDSNLHAKQEHSQSDVTHPHFLNKIFS